MQRNSRHTYQQWTDHVEHIAETLIRQVEQGTAPFQVPWEPGKRMIPLNLASQRDYGAMNALWLAMQARERGYEDFRWGTYRQIQAGGGQVRRGERGTRVIGVFEVDQDTEPEARGGGIKGEERRTVRLKVYTVFNAQQADGLAAMPRLEPAWDPCELAETVLRKSGVRILHMQDNRAYYNPGRDWVVVPSRAQFSTRAEYYAVVLHELAHATGHPDRMNRGPLTGDHTSPSYAREELRAEIASMMACTQLGVGHFPKNNIAYVASWVRGLRGDPMEIRKATHDASQMASYLLRGMGREKNLDMAWKTPTHDRGQDTTYARSPLSPFEGLELSHPIMIGGHGTSIHHAARSHEMGLSR